MLCSAFRSDGSFEPILLMQENVLRELFEAEVFKLLVKKELISRELISKMRTWRHSGFHVYAGPAVTDIQDAVRVGLYIVRPSASSGRLQLAQDPGWLKYLAKGSQPHPYSDSLFEPNGQVFDYLEWIARLTSHIPDKGAQTVHYYGLCGRPHKPYYVDLGIMRSSPWQATASVFASQHNHRLSRKWSKLSVAWYLVFFSSGGWSEPRARSFILRSAST